VLAPQQRVLQQNRRQPDITFAAVNVVVGRKGCLQRSPREGPESALTFDSLVGGDAWGEYGSLTVTKVAVLDGKLALDLANGFTLAAGDSFDLFNFAGLSFTSPTDDFRTLTFDGAGCVDQGGGVWSCSNLGPLELTETITGSALDINVVATPLAIANSFAVGSVATFTIPEPSTRVMFGVAFLGLGGIGLRRRRSGPVGA
jgi:hypothetical protein